MIAIAEKSLLKRVPQVSGFSFTRDMKNVLQTVKINPNCLKTKFVKNAQVATATYHNRFFEFENPRRFTKHHTYCRKEPHLKNLELKQCFNSYMQDIKDCTGRAVSKEQQDLLKNYIETNPIKKLSSEDMKNHRIDFTQKRSDIRREWSFKNHQEWPRYENNVVIEGKVERQIGNFYDAHHIIENCYGGPNEWWNMHPARYPEQHQDGIHRDEGICSKLFGKIRKFHK